MNLQNIKGKFPDLIAKYREIMGAPYVDGKLAELGIVPSSRMSLVDVKRLFPVMVSDLDDVKERLKTGNPANATPAVATPPAPVQTKAEEYVAMTPGAAKTAFYREHKAAIVAAASDAEKRNQTARNAPRSMTEEQADLLAQYQSLHGAAKTAFFRKYRAELKSLVNLR